MKGLYLSISFLHQIIPYARMPKKSLPSRSPLVCVFVVFVILVPNHLSTAINHIFLLLLWLFYLLHIINFLCGILLALMCVCIAKMICKYLHMGFKQKHFLCAIRHQRGYKLKQCKLIVAHHQRIPIVLFQQNCNRNTILK